jgi:hypothetical protein
MNHDAVILVGTKIPFSRQTDDKKTRVRTFFIVFLDFQGSGNQNFTEDRDS